MLQKFLKIFFLSYSLIFSSFAGQVREIGFDVGTLKTQGSTPSNPASGKNKLYVKDGNLKLLDSTGSEKDIGSSESDNFMTDPGAELVNPTCVSYADAAGTSPVDGTGGTPNVSVSHSDTSPLSGKRSLVFSKTATNSQGQGFSCDFTIDNASKGKVLRTQFDYEISSGTYATGDLKVFIYDKTNAKIIEPSAYSIENSSLKETKFSEWQSSIDSTSYRLVVHITSTSASAFSLKFDSFKTGRGPKVYGSVTTDYVNAGTITIGATTTAPTKGTIVTDRILMARSGQRLLADYHFQQTVAGTAGSGDYLFSLPNGYQFDSSIVGFYTGSNVNDPAMSKSIVGYSVQNDGSTISTTSILVAYDATRFRVIAMWGVGNKGFISSTYFNLGLAQGYSFRLDAPIQGWSSSQQLSQDADTRVITANVRKTNTQTLTTSIETKVTFQTVQNDDTAMWDSANNRMIIKASGKYRIYSQVLHVTNGSGAGARISIIYKNGVSQTYNRNTGASTTDVVASVSDVLDLRANDYIEIYALQTSGSNANIGGDPQYSFFNIERISGPSQISASETVSASYWLNANFTASATTPINFDSKEFDSHGSVTTSPTAWKFTAPASGLYSIQGFITYGGAVNTHIHIYKNGVFYKTLSQMINGAQLSQGISSATIRLLSGDYIDIRTSASSLVGGNASLASSSASHISITRIGL